jgi:Fe-S cluster biogenesis protein NfuA
VFIQTEATPNPESLKFIPGRIVMASGTASFASKEDCLKSPLAKRLMDVRHVVGVFFGNDFITITKESEADWFTLKPMILGIIMEHFIANLPVIVEGHDAESTQSNDDGDPLIQQIKELIDTRVRPAVAQDGGDITFHSFVDGVVYLKMQGACAGCPSSTATLKSGIENMLRYYVPEVLEVRAIE